MHRVDLLIEALLVVDDSMVAAQDSAVVEQRIWVPIPGTPGSNSGGTVSRPGDSQITIRSDRSGGYTIRQVGTAPMSVKPLWGGEAPCAPPILVPIPSGF